MHWSETHLLWILVCFLKSEGDQFWAQTMATGVLGMSPLCSIHCLLVANDLHINAMDRNQISQNRFNPICCNWCSFQEDNVNILAHQTYKVLSIRCGFSAMWLNSLQELAVTEYSTEVHSIWGWWGWLLSPYVYVFFSFTHIE